MNTNNAILIGIIVILCVSIGIVSWAIFNKLAVKEEKEEIVQDDPVDPVVEESVFVPDETIPAEFCRQLINRAQLKEITGHNEGRFAFEEEKVEDPAVGFVKRCRIKIDEYEKKTMGIGFVLDRTYEELYESIKKEMTELIEMGFIPEGIRKIQDVGERAFSLSIIVEKIAAISETHMIGFVDADTNQVIMIGVQEFSYETALNFAKQVEANVK